MPWSTHAFLLATALAAGAALATAAAIWRRRPAAGATQLALAMVAASVWAGSLVAEGITAAALGAALACRPGPWG